MGCSSSKDDDIKQNHKEEQLPPIGTSNNVIATSATVVTGPAASAPATVLSARRACEGYPPPLLPREVKNGIVEEIEFYIEGSESDTALACSLVKYVGNDEHDVNTTMKPITMVEAYQNSFTSKYTTSTFEIDSSLPIMIICHGFLSWRNQMLIGNLGIDLASKAKCHTIRFDFTGEGASEGRWSRGNCERQIQDLYAVVKFVQARMKISNIQCIIGHSKGTVPIFQYASQQQQQQQQLPYVPNFVAMAGRFHPYSLEEKLQSLPEQFRIDLERDGQYTKYLVGDNRKFIVTQKDIEDEAHEEMELLSAKDTSKIDGTLTNMLIIHGDNDETTPVSNAYDFSQTIPQNTLWIIKGADHNFNGLRYKDTLTKGILDFVNNTITKDENNNFNMIKHDNATDTIITTMVKNKSTIDNSNNGDSKNIKKKKRVSIQTPSEAQEESDDFGADFF
eukprot:CAMPEP_0195288418 /NCGR_PEP_ID=MMETSP0707-20130614/5090_1 /TAXON_ID=33640 /ORGANISM="Asterionellopsis glacialis, Strain CCMP134" /LENGTH=448 /DNA_ID=CAMNT_0040348285 /DNA_START=65 /DNA_END=1411 /DNA_ORIENTATION=-